MDNIRLWPNNFGVALPLSLSPRKVNFTIFIATDFSGKNSVEQLCVASPSGREIVRVFKDRNFSRENKTIMS